MDAVIYLLNRNQDKIKDFVILEELVMFKFKHQRISIDYEISEGKLEYFYQTFDTRAMDVVYTFDSQIAVVDFLKKKLQ